MWLDTSSNGTAKTDTKTPLLESLAVISPKLLITSATSLQHIFHLDRN